MTRAMIALLLLTATALLALPSTEAADSTRRSGITIAVEEAEGRLVFEEMGPWTGEVASAVTRREVRLEPDLEITLVRRDPDGTGADGWRGGFEETPIAVSAVRPGDYITVETRRREGDLVAARIQVIRFEPRG
jgi:hypothetical protein